MVEEERRRERELQEVSIEWNLVCHVPRTWGGISWSILIASVLPVHCLHYYYTLRRACHGAVRSAASRVYRIDTGRYLEEVLRPTLHLSVSSSLRR